MGGLVGPGVGRVTLDGPPPPGDVRPRHRIGGPMGWLAILAILIFVAVIAAFNRVEFGRFD
jgi:hypothetical protein